MSRTVINLLVGILVVLGVVSTSTIAHAEGGEEKGMTPGWQDPEFMWKGTIRAPLSTVNKPAANPGGHNPELKYQTPRVELQGTTILWHERQGKDIFIGMMGSRFNLWEHSWVIAQAGGASNWFHNGAGAAIMSVETEFSLIHDRLTFNGEFYAMLGSQQKREFFGWQSLDLWFAHHFNVGLHSEQIGNRTLLFGVNTGFVTPKKDWNFEVQYLEGVIDHTRGRTFRFVLSFDLPVLH
ncbi:MAG: hypothetical protein U0519_03485 [Candidatus Gracilibacteria bacterium]